MSGAGTVWGLGLSVFVAALVELVEALTIVLAMGATRGWRSALAGVGAALVALVALTAAAGYALTTWLPQSLLQLVVGTLLLVMGLQWLRKAVLRSAGRKALHDEDAIFRRQEEAGRSAGSQRRLGLDTFGFVVTAKAVFLEGAEVVVIVLTFGLNAGDVPVAILGAAAALVVVLGAAVLVRGPLSRVPENTLKYIVGLLLSTFGTFWAVEGLGVLTPSGRSLSWPGGELAIPVLLLAWTVLSRAWVAGLRRPQAVA